MKTTQEKSAERKRQRTIKKIYEIIKDKNAVFLTLSFNDATLKNTSAETRKRYIKNYLKSETALYIANIDYGNKKGREHYHAIIKANTLKTTPKRYENIKNYVNTNAYKYGNIRADFIGTQNRFKNNNDMMQTARNLYKHAIKETTQNNKLIFSRCEPNETQQLKRLKRLEKELQINRDKPYNKYNDNALKEIINEINADLNSVKKTQPNNYLNHYKKSFFDA